MGTETRIYLSDNRGIAENTQIRRYSTLNFGDYYNPNQQAIGNLYAVNDEIIAPACKSDFYIDIPSVIAIIPAHNSVKLTHKNQPIDVFPGEVLLIPLAEKEFFSIENTSEDELCNVLHIWIKIPNGIFPADEKRIPNFTNSQNRLNSLNYPFVKINTGIYNGRHNTLHQLQKQFKNVFVFVIEGAFEVNNCLLHPRDGLHIYNTNEVDFEALSNNAVILILEF